MKTETIKTLLDLFKVCVVDGQFVVYTTRVGGGRVSSSNKDQTLAKRGIIHRWTVRDLFDTIGIEYTTTARSEVDHDLTYAGFTIDRLERLLGV